MPNYPTVLRNTDVRNCYHEWQDPVAIISDGPHRADNLVNWYRPHIKLWSARARSDTTLWFWCSEVGFAEVHPLLLSNGWIFRGCNVWDKGVANAIGRNAVVPTAFPSVTEVCVQYVRSNDAKFHYPTTLTANTWREGAVRGSERLKKGRVRQKPLRLMDLIISASTDPGDVVWEPFGGSCDGGASAYALGRISYFAEKDSDTFDTACARINLLTEDEREKGAQRDLFDEVMGGEDSETSSSVSCAEPTDDTPPTS